MTTLWKTGNLSAMQNIAADPVHTEPDIAEPVKLSPVEEFLRDTGHAWRRRDDGMIIVAGLDLGKPSLEKCGKWPLSALPDLTSVIVEGDFAAATINSRHSKAARKQ